MLSHKRPYFYFSWHTVTKFRSSLENMTSVERPSWIIHYKESPAQSLAHLTVSFSSRILSCLKFVFIRTWEKIWLFFFLWTPWKLPGALCISKWILEDSNIHTETCIGLFESWIGSSSPMYLMTFSPAFPFHKGFWFSSSLISKVCHIYCVSSFLSFSHLSLLSP